LKEPETANLPTISTGPGMDRPKTGGEIIIDTLVRDASEIAITRTRPEFRIGHYELHEEAYRQILIWAKVAGKELEEIAKEVSDRLGLSARRSGRSFRMALRPAPIRIRRMLAPKSRLHQLELTAFEDGQIKHLSVFSSIECSLSDKPRSRRYVDLSHVPVLAKLWCDLAGLTELDLSNVPALN
jgi:hypothetical protein